jgi:predicted permease
VETLLSDIKHGCRLLARSWGFTTTVILALALGIGANTAVFSVMNAVLLKPLHYKDPDRIVSVAGRFTGIGIPDDRNQISPPELMDIRKFSTVFSDVAAVQGANFNIRVTDTPERILGATVTSNFFRTLGVEAKAGRTFAGDEDTQGKNGVIVIGYRLWQRLFGLDADVVGRAVDINGRTYSIIGVMPQDFEFPPQTEMWTPLVLTDAQLSPNFRGSHLLSVYARIKPEVPMPRALADMQLVSAQIIENAKQYPYPTFNFAVLIRPLLEDFVGDVRPALIMLMGAVALVLLIACCNVANLLMVRASARDREIGIRAALGASRKRLVRQLLTESLLLSSIGAIFGVGIAKLGVSMIASVGAKAFPRLASAGLDSGTLVFTVAVTFATGILFGVAPAVQSSQDCRYDSLKEGGRGTSTGTAGQRLRKMLVVGEVALSLALLAGAGLLIQSFMRLQSVDPGFRTQGVLTIRVSLPPARYPEPAKINSFFRNLLDRVRQVPGVQSAGAVSGLPLSGNGGSGTVTPDSPLVRSGQYPEADQRFITPGYFETVGTKLIAGRYFEDHDTATGAPVAIIDETMAKTYWPATDPIGKRIKFGGPQSTNPWMTIVGIVRHVRSASLESPSRVELYAPHAQVSLNTMSLAIKTAGDIHSISNAIQKATASIDPEQPIYAIRPFSDLVADSMLRRRLIMILLAVFAGVALTLAALGIYGVISYWVSQRSREIGIRLALGASRTAVLKMVIGQSLWVVLVGIAAGLALSAGLSRGITTMLFNINAADPATFIMVCGALVAVGLAASLVPALRATLVDPADTLRQE